MPQRTLLAPSILAGDHACLRQSAEIATKAGAEWLHLDIMDGHFVPNLTFGPQTLHALRPHCKLFFDTHLMLLRPQDYIEAFAQAGADQITVHVEAEHDIGETLQRIADLGCKRGLAFNPKTPASAVLPYLDQVDLVLAMTVEPGFGGQSFDTTVPTKIREIDRARSGQALDFRLEVDGGIDEATGRSCFDAGTDTFVAGTAFFKASDKGAFIKSIQGLS